VSIEGTDAATLVGLIVAWYESVRAEDSASLDKDGDGLLFQWGTYDFGSGRSLRYGVTRQFITAGDDGAMWQLAAVLLFEPTAEAEATGSGEFWCFSPDDLGAFREAVASSPATAHVATRSAVGMDLWLEEV
jgi:hypothetical protein